jgi:ketosteroid isomerase-like protein
MKQQPAWALAVSFVDAINGNDVERLGSLMSNDHELKIFGEAPVVGRAANVEAWRGYCGSWPAYVIYPRRMAQTGDTVAILGHTTGSHLGLADEEESQLTLIWLCRERGGRVASWELIEDNATNRSRWQLA